MVSCIGIPPVHHRILSPRVPFWGITVTEVVQAGFDHTLAVDRIFVVVPVVRAANAKTTPPAVVFAGKVCPRDIDTGAVQKFMVEIGYAVNVGSVLHAFGILPAIAIFQGNAETALQAVAAFQTDRSAEGIRKIVEVYA